VRETAVKRQNGILEAKKAANLFCDIVPKAINRIDRQPKYGVCAIKAGAFIMWLVAKKADWQPSCHKIRESPRKNKLEHVTKTASRNRESVYRTVQISSYSGY